VRMLATWQWRHVYKSVLGPELWAHARTLPCTDYRPLHAPMHRRLLHILMNCRTMHVPICHRQARPQTASAALQPEKQPGVSSQVRHNMAYGGQCERSRTRALGGPQGLGFNNP